MKKYLTAICICIFLLSSLVSGQQDSVPLTNEVLKNIQPDKELTGPTIYLDFDGDVPKENSISAFMYFVPMISTVPVDSQSSSGNQQKTRILSCQRESNGKTFKMICKFEMWGSGYFTNKFDVEEVIKEGAREIPDLKPLKNLIDYIRFEGSGRGSVNIKGSIVDGVETIDSVKVIFNEDGCKSPATVGLYSVKAENGCYNPRNSYSLTIARVNSLSFLAEHESEPKMEIELASIRASGAKDGFFSRLKGCIANLFIKPLRINRAGNDAMMDFGYALYKEHASFTFPKAPNLKSKTKDDDKQTIVASSSKKKQPDTVSLD